LDPEGKIADHQIWSYVRDAKLKHFLDEMSDGLDTVIQPGGSTLSNGEQKVICCIRGLLRELINYNSLHLLSIGL
jgi:ABC-type multidrug transport system fused ATPase/permease subunit